MAERELYSNKSAADFPFKLVSPEVRLKLSKFLRKFDTEDTSEPHANFVTTLNSTLVWTGARTASLPQWNYCEKARVDAFIRYLNKVSRRIQKRHSHVQELLVLNRSHIYSSGGVVEQGTVVRCKNPRVRPTSDPPINDAEIGRELDMYPLNADQFAAEQELGDAFTIWEAGSEALLYAERWSRDLLSHTQLQEFLVHCQKRVALWNAAMEKLGLPYRFYGTMDWKRSEIPWDEAANTISLFGKPYLGASRRGEDYCGSSAKKTKSGILPVKEVDFRSSRRKQTRLHRQDRHRPIQAR